MEATAHWEEETIIIIIYIYICVCVCVRLLLKKSAEPFFVPTPGRKVLAGVGKVAKRLQKAKGKGKGKGQKKKLCACKRRLFVKLKNLHTFSSFPPFLLALQCGRRRRCVYVFVCSSCSSCSPLDLAKKKKLWRERSSHSHSFIYIYILYIKNIKKKYSSSPSCLLP